MVEREDEGHARSFAVRARRGKRARATGCGLARIGMLAYQFASMLEARPDFARSPGFLGYLLFPRCVYAISATRTPSSIKISVGVNPWSRDKRRHDIGDLCARHGGGGHAVVGGVTLRGDELPRARDTLTKLVRELTT